ncbi:uncharacterized protein TRIADDRAFT_27763 [Trichoplax adhaerens]|uniref:Non-specific serine/threonine protein kinase n=1 Tax=Trichoplax adhaerens TaxID=10228 RepID=B3S1W9_TRIAD|nr:hypothetical protein TRIADDRAFT_27763 [Trichoplax adhaerens]EDV23578.1 hypothetical protein TRIADDRAFT_27763 [Trichoplax adhaerens]|eukprot:XP_002114488.1 hypothetical protein TRIADDRAFT_27763 [Trichoplax adhaerens]
MVRDECDNYRRELSQLKNGTDRSKRICEELREQLAEKQSHIENQELTLSTLRKTCNILEAQIQDLEYINEELEAKESSYNKLQVELENNMDEAERTIASTKASLETEKQSRLYFENKVLEFENLQKDSFSKHTKDVEKYYQQLEEYKKESAIMNNDMGALERKQTVLELDNKSLKQQFEHQTKLYRKAEKELRKCQNDLVAARKANFILNQDIESTSEEKEMLSIKIAELESQLELVQNMHNEEKMKLQATAMQQSKLIDYIQSSGTQKKKKLLGKTFNGNTNKEIQDLLDKEKANNIQLKSKITRLRSELEASRLETGRLKRKLTDLMDKEIAGEKSLLDNTLDESSMNESINKPINERSKERIHHNIPHRLTTCLTMRPVSCSVCLHSIHFGRQVAKCTECQTTCHVKCSPALPHNCGLPLELLEHLTVDINNNNNNNKTDTDKKHTIKQQQSSLSIAGHKLQGWMKVKRPGSTKKNWENRWIVLAEDRIALYNKERDESPLEEFSLILKNSETVINAEVNSVELSSVASTDRPFIIGIEIRPITACWPSQIMYLMASNFTEKQRWVKALEHLIDDQEDSSRPVDGNVILELHGKSVKEINCTLPSKEKYVFVGCEEGLFTLHSSSIKSSHRSGSLNQLSGIPGVFQMQYTDDQQMLILITGKDKQLCWIDRDDLSKKAGTFPQMKLAINTVQNIHSCHLFSSARINGRLYVCAALQNKTTLLEFSAKDKTFCIKKEIATQEPCSCIQFTNSGVIIGTDRYHIINLKTNEINEFLDRDDSSLAFAIYGVSSASSFPIACIKISDEEYLLCFSEFGIFVNECGKRTRKDDLKWSRLPLTFVYREPFLYVTHFNSMEIIQIHPDNRFFTLISVSRHLMNLASPRYLGPALTQGYIYVGSVHSDSVKMIAIQGKGIKSIHSKQSVQRTPLNEAIENGQISSRKVGKSKVTASKKIPQHQSENRDMGGTINNNAQTCV